jgi:hypothetical protein
MIDRQDSAENFAMAALNELTTVTHNWSILRTFFWQHILAQYSHLQYNNTKFIKSGVHNCIKIY